MVQVNAAVDDDALHLVRTRPLAVAGELNDPGFFPVHRADGVGIEMRQPQAVLRQEAVMAVASCSLMRNPE